MTDYKEKIKKLLSLAQSQNEHEARAALLKARELMAEYKLCEADLEDVGKQEVKDVAVNFTCTKRSNPWMINLSGIIAQYYCCKGYGQHHYGGQKQYIGFIGFENDVEICVAIFKYAVDCILSHNKKIKKDYREYGYSAEEIKRLCDSYGYGFAYGVKEAFEKQQEEKQQEWGLALVTPKEVQEASADWKAEKFQSKATQDIQSSAFQKGFFDGTEFDPKHRLDGDETAEDEDSKYKFRLEA